MKILLGGMFCGLACAAAAATGALEAEWAQQFAALQHDLNSRPAFAKVAGETFRPEALLLAGHVAAHGTAGVA